MSILTAPKDEEKISEALALHLDVIWTPAVEGAINQSYGEQIACSAKQVYDAAIDCPVDWYANDMNEALRILHEFLALEYPWLSSEAKTKLNYSFIITWK